MRLPVRPSVDDAGKSIAVGGPKDLSHAQSRAFRGKWPPQPKMPGETKKTFENCPRVSCSSRTVHSNSFFYR